MATERSKKTTPTWSDVKSKLADFDRAGMLTLVQDIYAASKENQIFCTRDLASATIPSSLTK